MVWGQKRGIGDLVERIKSNDATLVSLCLLRGRTFDDDCAAQLFGALASNTTLRELSISSHAVGPTAAAACARALEANTVLCSLDLGDSRFGDVGLAALAPGIAASSSLRQLRLEGKGISVTGCALLSAALANNRSSDSGVEVLLLGRNSIGTKGLEALLAGCCSAGATRLQEIDLHECALDGAAAAQPLVAALLEGALPCLRVLRLDGNQLGDEWAAQVASALSTSASLQALHLQRCGLEASGIAALAAKLPPCLETLDLSGNSLGSAGAKMLAAQLASGAAPRLQSLLLGCAGLDDADIAALAGALTARTAPVAALRFHLDVSGNVAGAAALAALAAAPLSSLCLHDCKLMANGAAGDSESSSGDEAASVLELLFSPGSCKRLRELDISANGLQAHQLTRVLAGLAPSNGAACHSNMPWPCLELLVVAANPGAAADDVQAALESLLQVRPQLQVVRRAADSGEAGHLGTHAP